MFCTQIWVPIRTIPEPNFLPGMAFMGIVLWKQHRHLDPPGKLAPVVPKNFSWLMKGNPQSMALRLYNDMLYRKFSTCFLFYDSIIELPLTLVIQLHHAPANEPSATSNRPVHSPHSWYVSKKSTPAFSMLKTTFRCEMLIYKNPGKTLKIRASISLSLEPTISVWKTVPLVLRVVQDQQHA